VQFAESQCVWPYVQTIIIIIITANIIHGKNFRHDLTAHVWYLFGQVMAVFGGDGCEWGEDDLEDDVAQNVAG
jgi:hypothetical protein